MLQFSSVPNFTFPIQLFIINKSRNLKQTFVLPPSCFISVSKYGKLTNGSTTSHYLLPIRIPVSASEYRSHLTRSLVFHVFIIE